MKKPKAGVLGSAYKTTKPLTEGKPRKPKAGVLGSAYKTSKPLTEGKPRKNQTQKTPLKNKKGPR